MFINARDVLGIIYTSKSGNTKLKWRELNRRVGRLSGEASTNSLVNLSMARIISPEDVESILANQGAQEAQETPMEPSEPAPDEGMQEGTEAGPESNQEVADSASGSA